MSSYQEPYTSVNTTVSGRFPPNQLELVDEIEGI
jgi:hypothetical protein